MIEEELTKKSETNHQLVEQMADLEIEKAELNDQLTKAKEILHKICYEYGIYDKDLMEEAKQFLKETN